MKGNLPPPHPGPLPLKGERVWVRGGKPEAVESKQIVALSNKFAGIALAVEGQSFGRTLEDLYFWKHPSLQK
jgi:hypothetical protein